MKNHIRKGVVILGKRLTKLSGSLSVEIPVHSDRSAQEEEPSLDSEFKNQPLSVKGGVKPGQCGGAK